MERRIIKKKVSFDLEIPIVDDIKKICQKLGIKQSELFRVAMHYYIENCLQFLPVIIINNDESFEKVLINIFDIEKIENEKIDNLDIELGFLSKGFLYLKNNEKKRFFSFYKLKDSELEKLKLDIQRCNKVILQLKNR